MKLVLSLVLLTTFTWAQDKPNLANASSACGPISTRFDVKTSSDPAPPVPSDPGKALVYFIEDFHKLPGEWWGDPTMRLGLDGAWIGATKSNSYISFALDTREHHMCVNWQSGAIVPGGYMAFARLNAEAGKTYYYRVQILSAGGAASSAAHINLELADPDEGQYLVASSSLSIWHAKK